MLLISVKKKVLIIFSIIFLIFAGATVYGALILTQDGIYKGVSIEDIDLSGIEKEIAAELVAQKMNEKLAGKKIVLKGIDNSWTIDPGDISLQYVAEDAIEKAYRAGRDGNILKRIQEIFRLRKDGINFTCDLTFNKEQLKNILTIIKKQVDKQEKNASLSYSNGEIAKTPEVVGVYLDVDKSFDAIEKNILDKNFEVNTLVINEVTPHITMNGIQNINGVIAEFRTYFSTAAENRAHNIRLACEKINNTILMPKDAFSMNKGIGPRTPENGYKTAPIILKDEFVEDVGGGVCQVTTTLYCAALLARLNITQRAPHSLPLGYVPPSHDATISGDYIDLKFENSLEDAVAINAEVSGGTICIRILGNNDMQKNIVKLRSEIVETYEAKVEVIIDNTLPVNEKVIVKAPQNGLKSRLFRDTYDVNGKLLKSELISEDVYNAVNGQIKINENFKEDQSGVL